MEKQLSWYDLHIIPTTKAYKNFVRKMEKTPAEHWFQDGERQLSPKEQKFNSIYQQGKERQAPKVSQKLIQLKIISLTI